MEWPAVADAVGGASVAFGGAVAGGSTGSGGTGAVAGEDGGMAAGVASHSLSVKEDEQFCDTLSVGGSTAQEVERMLTGVTSPLGGLSSVRKMRMRTMMI